MPVSKNRTQLPQMTPGTSRGIVWMRYGRSGARPKVYMEAAIHANELPGAMLIHHLLPMLNFNRNWPDLSGAVAEQIGTNLGQSNAG